MDYSDEFKCMFHTYFFYIKEIDILYFNYLDRLGRKLKQGFSIDNDRWYKEDRK